MYGEGMVETTVAIDNDRTFTLTCHVDDVENVEEIILLCKTKFEIRNAPALEQGEAVTKLWECLGIWSAYLARNGEQAELSPPSWLMDAVKNATTPQQPQSVADALEEALGICAKIKTPDNFTDAEKHVFEQATTEYWRAIRALIKRNAKEGK